MEGGDTLRLKYATLLHIVDYGNFKTVEIDNPWKKGAILHRYVLADRDKPLPSSLPEGSLIRIPADRTVVFTAAHCQLMGWLGAQQQLSGVADLKYIKVDYVKEGVNHGQIADCGDGMNPVVEKIIDMKPDLLMVSPFENSGGYGRLDDIGIPLVECADYMETSPLARAEWMKFYGMLLGKGHEADSLFEEVETHYQQLCEEASKTKTRTSILTEKLTGGTWYVPGGKSSVGQLIADANGTYAWSKDSHSGSLAMTFETVLDKAGNADVWIFNHFGSGDLTYNRLASEYAGYQEIKAFKDHRVYYVDSEKVPYFEEVSFKPYLLLSDYIAILHPDSKIQQLNYYRPVK